MDGIEMIEPCGEDRVGARVAELTEHLGLSAGPPGTRRICWRERLHPGDQFEIFDDHGYRYSCFLTDQDAHRAFQHTETWLEVSLIAQEAALLDRAGVT